MRACEPEPFCRAGVMQFLRATKFSRQKHPNMDTMPFSGVDYIWSACALQSRNMAESSAESVKEDDELIFHF